MLGIPFKGTGRTDVASAVRAYISSKYPPGELDKHAEALSTFQGLRDAVTSVRAANEGGVTALRKYLAQLPGYEEKVAKHADAAKVVFAWTDCLRPSVVVAQSSVVYERACVLFNLAAAESQFGCNVARDTPEGKDKARTHFCAAAGMLIYLKENLASRLLGEVPFDLTPDGLTCLSSLMLAQAQAVYYEAARQRGSPPLVLSRLAGAAADFYRTAGKCLHGQHGGEAEAAWPWRSHCESWAALFDAASFRQWALKVRAEAEASGEGYGTEIAWLTAADNAAKTSYQAAARTARADGAPPAVDTAPSASLSREVSERLAEAKNENQKVYFQLVPRLEELAPIQRAVLAKATPFAEPRPGEDTGVKPLFEGLVPPELAASAAHLDDSLEALVRDAKDRAAAANTLARGVLTELGLPGYLESAGGAGGGAEPGLPASVWARVQACQVAGGLPELERLHAANAAAAGKAGEALREAEAALDAEAGEDAKARAAHGPRWTAVASAIASGDLRGELGKLRAVAQAAAGSDASVAGKLEAARPALARWLAARSKAEVDAAIPPPPAANEPAGGEAGEALRGELRRALGELSALMEARPRLCADVRDKFDREAFLRAMAVAPAKEHGAILDRAMAAMGGSGSGRAGGGDALASSASGPSVAAAAAVAAGGGSPGAALDANLAAQQPLLDRIRAAHARYAEVRGRDERTIGHERAVQAVCEACDRFQEVKGHLREGADFWTELNARAAALAQSARDFAQARAWQARELSMGIQNAAAAAAAAGGLSIGVPTGAAGYAPPTSPHPPLTPQQPLYPPHGGTPVPLSGAPAAAQPVNPFDAFTPSAAAPGQLQHGATPVALPPAGAAPQGPGQGQCSPYMATPPGSSAASSAAGHQQQYYQQPLQQYQQPPPPPPPPQYQQQQGYPQPQPQSGYPVAQPVHGYGGGYPGAIAAAQQPPPQQVRRGPDGYFGAQPAAAPAAAAPGGGAAAGAAEAQLVSMGFARPTVQRALAMHGGDLNAALNQLLVDGSSGSGV